ncbi:MAG: urea ABC transporter permease subunit UrtC [Chloroflexi bacterium]|nr:urea ABC transporter permease subunit UrtC [Chloroflexota bacterium]
MEQRRSLTGAAVRESAVVAAICLLMIVVLPLVLSEFRLALLAKFLTFAIVALAIDLAWGYTGMLSLGHGVFFGLGAYALAMHMKLEAAKDGLPDFMGWSGLRELPGFWAPFDNGLFALAMVVVLPALLAAGLGILIFRGRVQGVYFSIITQALALIATLVFVGQQPYTGGTNGMTNFSTLFGLPLIETSTQIGLYAVTVIVLGLTYLALRFLTGSRAGAILVAIRDSESRLRFFGYDPALVKVAVFTLSAAIAGIAGALFVPQVGIITPANMGIVPSIEMVIWVAVGGRGTLYGPILGAIVVNGAKSGLSESFPDFWQYFLGAMFVGSVVLFPDGIVGAVARGVKKLKGARSASLTAGATAHDLPSAGRPLEAKS